MAELVIRVDKDLASKAFKGLLAAALVFSAVPELASESVTLTTYYPAPSGVYAQMITTGNTYLARDTGGVGIANAGPLQGTLDVIGRAGVNTIVARPSSNTDAVRVTPDADNEGSVAYGVTNAANSAWKAYILKNGAAYFSGAVSAGQMGTNAGNTFTSAGNSDIQGNLGIGVASPGVRLDVVNGGAIRVGTAYLSDGGNQYMHLANHEYFNGGWWVTDGQPGALLQMAGQNINFYKHDAGGSHTTLAVLDANGSLNTYGGYIRAGSSLVSPLGCWAINMNLNGYATGWNGGCPGGNYVTLQSGVYSIYVAVPFPYASNTNYQQQYLDALCCPCPPGGCQF